MVNPNWPLTVTSVAFNADPFDATATPTFVDTSSRVREFEAQAGRQYELDTMQAGEATLTVSDKDEAFNPTNPSSTYYPNVLPYRQICDQAMWPPAPIGAAVNLLPGQLSPVVDPTFESYTSGAGVSWVLATGTGVTPTVTTSNPQQGTKSLTYTVTSGAGTSGVGLAVTTIPGQQYTASLYLRQTAANSTQIFINGGAGGTSTATTGSYVRLSVTFTATRPTHQLWVASFTTSSNSTVNVDAIQVEPGASASTFSSAAGPVIYGNFAGYVERWPKTWNHQGMYGMAQITAVDGMAVLAGQFLGTELHNAVVSKTPDYYWALSEQDGSTSFAETSGNQGPALTRLDGPFGPAPTFAPGTDAATPGDPGGTGVKVDTAGVSANVAGSVMQAGFTPDATKIAIGGPLPINWSIAFVFAHTAPLLAQGEFMVSTGSPTDATLVSVTTQVTSGVQQLLFASTYLPAGSVAFGSASITLTDLWADAKPHLYVVTGTVTTTTVSMTVWIDGVQVGTRSSAVSSGPASLAETQTWIQVGGYIWQYQTNVGASTPNGVYSHVAVWNRAVSSTEVADLTNAFKGYPAENSGARVARYLGYNWIGGTAIDTGQSNLGVSDLAGNTSVLDAVQAVALSEGGQAFVDETGTITFQSRSRRFLNTTAKWSMGEQESQYEPDIAYDYDPTLIFNDPEVTRSGGSTVVGGTLAVRQASWKRYGKRSYTITVNLATDLETQDRANWIFYTHKDPKQRLSTLTLKPSANPALWPVCLGLQISDRATVKRRTAAGYTMASDYFVERIEQRRVPGEWTFTLQLSPAAATGQPWILGDATYGQLDVSCVLGY